MAAQKNVYSVRIDTDLAVGWITDQHGRRQGPNSQDLEDLRWRCKMLNLGEKIEQKLGHPLHK